MLGLTLKFSVTHQTENPRDTSTNCELCVSKFSEVGENKQLLIAIVGQRFYIFNNLLVETKTFFAIVSRIDMSKIKCFNSGEDGKSNS